MRAVQLTAFGNPVDGLECVDILSPTLPAQTRSSSASSIPPSTRTTSWSHRAIYAFCPSLPAVIGNEGVCRVLAWGREWRASG